MTDDYLHCVAQVNYINAHATSTHAGDLAEANVLKQVFKNPSQIKLNATKVLWYPDDQILLICIIEESFFFCNFTSYRYTASLS